jgi:S1-C subfamily serine protease
MRFALLLTLILLPFGTATADQMSTLKSGNWSGGAYGVDGRFSHCSMAASYANGNILLFKIYANGAWAVEIANEKFNFVPNENVTLQASVDGADPVEIKGQAITKNEIGFFIGNVATIATYRNAARLRFYVSGAISLPFDLTGFSAASDVLHQCYRHSMGLDADAAHAEKPASAPAPETLKTAARVPPPSTTPKTKPEADDEASGSGVVINKLGQILTNAHVIHACRKLEVGTTSRSLTAAKVVAVDERNDLAVIQPIALIGDPIAFKDGKGLRPGEDIVALGYPYSGLLASEANVARGSVTALSGLMDDSRFVQISAPIQPGNSGGPLLDMNGRLVGIDTSTLNALLMVKATGSVPQNVNFAIKASVARDFLDAKSINYDATPADHALSPEEVSELGRKSTLLVVCNGAN